MPLSRIHHFVFLALAICLIVPTSLLFFPYSTPKSISFEAVDLVAVFPGSQERISTAYRLVRQGYADSIAITSGSVRTGNHYDLENNETSPLKHVFRGNARSTFEDALFVEELTKRKGFKSIILVTGDYHLPRASFLLHALLADQVKLYTYGVAMETERGGQDRVTLSRQKFAFNERMKFIGSLIEMGIYRTTGILINDYPWIRNTKDALKRLFLFDTESSA